MKTSERFVTAVAVAVLAALMADASAQVRRAAAGRRGAVVHGEERTVAVGRGGGVAVGEEGAAAVGRRGAVVAGEEGVAAVGRYGGKSRRTKTIKGSGVS